jgi:hypothetical protein
MDARQDVRHDHPQCSSLDGRLTAVRGEVRLNGEVLLTCWHAETDTLPWVQDITTDDGQVVEGEHLDVFVPVGVFSRFGEIAHVTVEVEVDGERRVYSNDDDGGLDVVRPAFVHGPLQQYRGHEPWRLLDAKHHRVDLDRHAVQNVAQKTYYLLELRVERDALLDYVVSATTPLVRSGHDGGFAATSAFSFRASAPVFGPDSLIAVEAPEGKSAALDRWALLRQDAGDLVHLRLDLLSTILGDGRQSQRPQIRITVGDIAVDLGDPRTEYGPQDRVLLPLLDREADTVLLTVPAEQLQGHTVDVQTWGPDGPIRRVDPTARPLRRVRFAIVNFAIQGHNDLFAEPRGPYVPPRTYMQLTMRDERGVFSSRPGSNEDGDPDGYALTLGAHRHYGIPAMWAFNAGVLTMIAHDCPDDLEQIREDITNGVLVPINPGFGAHRPPFYQAETNIEEIRRGADVIKAFLPETPEVGLRTYHPDQRLYEARDCEVAAYTEPGLVRYVVLDRSGLCHGDGVPPGTGPGSGPEQTRFFDDPGLPADQVHRDPHTDTRILPIEDKARESFMGGDDDAERGKAGTEFRALMFGELKSLNDAHDEVPQVVVYGDDADKASGCGWFDGDYAGMPLHFDAKYQAALCWLRRHPWVEVVTVADLDQGEATDLPAPLWSGSCPSVDPSAATATDRYGNVLHFDTWYQQWWAWPSPWLGRTLGEVSEKIEQQLLAASDAATEFDTGLVDIAWMTFLALHHEMFWNKEALEGGLVDQRCGVLAPEDFVIAASLHLGLTRLYLCAARWAGLAPKLGPQTCVSEGQLVEELAKDAFAGSDGLHWDDDLLPNDLLYNDEVLVVLDRNGGRAIAIFTRTDDGQAICVSGTPKAFQWTQPDPDPDPRIESPPWLTCDGNVLENSVLTPNHQYVVADLDQSAPRIGRHHEDRARQQSPQRWLYPDTFDEYDATPDSDTGSISYRYARSSGPQPGDEVDSNVFEAACRQDHAARSQSGAERVIWHDDDLALTKTLHLDGRRVTVTYPDVPAGHQVANEFSVDLRSQMTGRGFQKRTVDPETGTATITGAARGSVTITPGVGCHLSPASLIADPGEAEKHGLSVEFLRLHRVLADTVVVECRDGEQFDYTIEIGS